MRQLDQLDGSKIYLVDELELTMERFMRSSRVTDAHLDSAMLATLREVMEDGYPLLLDTFLSDSEERLRLLQEACNAAQAQSLLQAAHSFKGSCSNMGAPLLAGLCHQLEDLAGRGDLAAAPDIIKRIECEFAIIRILYRAERQRYGSPN